MGNSSKLVAKGFVDVNMSILEALEQTRLVILNERM